METLTLLQTGKREPLPVVLMDRPGGEYWSAWERFLVEELAGGSHIQPGDLHLYHRTADVAEAVDHIRMFYRRYHSLRYVRDQLIVRLTEDLSEAQVDALNREFADMLTPGGTIRPVSALTEEQEDTAIRHLPRLRIDFDRRQFHRLRRMIDRINRM